MLNIVVIFFQIGELKITDAELQEDLDLAISHYYPKYIKQETKEKIVNRVNKSEYSYPFLFDILLLFIVFPAYLVFELLMYSFEKSYKKEK